MRSVLTDRKLRSEGNSVSIFCLDGRYLLAETRKLNFYVFLTVHLSIFISVFNQLDTQNLFHNKFYFMPLHVSSNCAHHQEVKIALYSHWYHHTYRWPSRTRGCVMQF